MHKFAFAVGLCNLPQRRFSSDFLRKTFGIRIFIRTFAAVTIRGRGNAYGNGHFYDLKPLTHDKKDSSIRYGGPPLRSPRLLTDHRLKKRTDAARDVPEWSSLTPLSTTANGSPGLGGGDIYIPRQTTAGSTLRPTCAYSAGMPPTAAAASPSGRGSDVYIGEAGRPAPACWPSGAPTASASPEGTAPSSRMTGQGPASSRSTCLWTRPRSTPTSDARLKRDVAGMGDVFAGLNALNPVTYRMAGYPIPADTLAGTGEEAQGANAAPTTACATGSSPGGDGDVPRAGQRELLRLPVGGLHRLHPDARQRGSGEMDAKIKEQEAVIESLTARENAPQRAGKGRRAGRHRRPGGREALAGAEPPQPVHGDHRHRMHASWRVADASLRIYDLQGQAGDEARR